MRRIKIETQKGHEIVASHILKQIEQGELLPGQKLPSVVDIALSYGVGRSTIREAVSALKAMGWLDVRHGGGTYVRSVLPSAEEGIGDLFKNADSIMELLEVRKIVERGAVALAAVRSTDSELLQVRNALVRMEQVLADNDTSKGERADVEFHQAIAAASGNSLLIQLMESLSQRLSESIRTTRELWFYEEKASASRLLEEHKAIYEAIASRDQSKAVLLVEAHLTKVENVLKTALKDSL
jgi:GntR family transcriptional repressor for pyruvate dehydrogenase complex